MLMINGVVSVGGKEFVRIENIRSDSPVGLEMLLNPFALVGKREDAEKIVEQLNKLEEYKGL